MRSMAVVAGGVDSAICIIFFFHLNSIEYASSAMKLN